MDKSHGLTSSTVDILTPVNNSNFSSQASIPPLNTKPSTKNNFLSECSHNIRSKLSNFQKEHKESIQIFIKLVINIGFITYFAFATKHFIDKGLDYLPFCDDDEYGILILLFSFIYLLILYAYIIKPYVISKIKFSDNNKNSCLSSPWLKWGIYILILVAILAFLIVDSWEDPNRLIALVGFSLMLIFGFVFSEHPGEIKWRPVILGLIVQFALGLFTIRWEHGRNIFKCTGDKVSTFLKYTDVGAGFVYGEDLIKTNVFAFQALSVIFFLSFFVKILYYYGVLQRVVLSLGWVLQVIMGTTICESVNSAANIFLGMTEAPILLQPYLVNLTMSELFAVMTAGFASVSGTVLAAYISFGAKPAHLITASVMSAPAALCFSKLYYPETEDSMSTEDTIEIPESDDTSVLGAASKGASLAVDIVLGISANVIAFVTFIAFLNGVIGWLGVLVGYDSWSVEEGMAYVFMPLSFVMGVPWDECKYVGKLIGIKTVINEFSAYKELGTMVKEGLLKPRTEMIATYAICGFSNPGSVGIMISTLSTLIPGKRDAITSMIFKSFTAGAIVCFMTACIAGMLISPDQL